MNGTIVPVIVMPAKAGIHSHRSVVMDTGLRWYDTQSRPAIQRVLILP
jgi:hypothetical protein